jgi:hypothetical protein
MRFADLSHHRELPARCSDNQWHLQEYIILTAAIISISDFHFDFAATSADEYRPDFPPTFSGAPPVTGVKAGSDAWECINKGRNLGSPRQSAILHVGGCGYYKAN